MPSTLIRNAAILTINDRMDLVSGAVSVRDGRIASIGPEPDGTHDMVIDAGGDYLLPGFIQTHVHLCQTLFRGYADDLRLMEWLRTRAWPMEAAHDTASLRAAARLGCYELLRGGTTAVLTMETVHETEVVCKAAAESGIRATIGKCMMDVPDGDTPARLRESMQRSIDDTLALRRAWDGAHGGRIRTAFAPRFALSCSRDLLEAIGTISAAQHALVHTHASEQREEVDLVRALTGQTNLAYLHDVGLASSRLCVAHCVWVDDEEQSLIAADDVKVMHCPGSNLKLGSGIAPVTDMLQRGICVSLGADGAACNNRLDMFAEMRLAATLQAVRSAPGALPAREAVVMATRNGARTLGLDADIGSVEPGKRADLILVARRSPHVAPDVDPYSTIVYAAGPDDVRMTMVDGVIRMKDGSAMWVDPAEIAADATRQARALAVRAGL